MTDDGRLTLSTVKATVRAGTVAVNHLRVVGLERSCAGVCGAVLEGRDGEGLVTVHGRAVVSAPRAAGSTGCSRFRGADPLCG